MMFNENAGEPKHAGEETKPEVTSCGLDGANIAPAAAVANVAGPCEQPGGRFHITSATMEVATIGKLGRPVRFRVIRIVLESGCKSFEFQCQGAKLWVQCWAVTGFNLN